VWIDRIRYVKLQCYFKSLFGWREIRVVRKGSEAKTGKYCSTKQHFLYFPSETTPIERFIDCNYVDFTSLFLGAIIGAKKFCHVKK
jgi:hypothetical protein